MSYNFFDSCYFHSNNKDQKVYFEGEWNGGNFLICSLESIYRNYLELNIDFFIISMHCIVRIVKTCQISV